MLRIHRPLLALAAVVAALSLTAASVDARSKSSVGSRGSNTYSAPPATATAPNAARPMDRTMTQPSQARPNAAPAAQIAARPGGMFGGLGGGLLGGLAAGFLGAGLIGMLTGSGFLGGMAGFASFLGLLIQVGLVVLAAVLAWRWWQRRNAPQTSTANGPSMRQGLDNGGRPQASPMLGGLFGGGSQAQAAPPMNRPIELQATDFETFERLLGEVQTAYGKEDLDVLGERVTSEMLSYYAEELANNKKNGDINQLTDVKLLQGDLSEAWAEGDDEYATVAMRYSLNDRIVARDDGRLIEQLPSEATELWTFRRSRGGNWIVSAVQQVEAQERAA
jgi:predicted lipid-binding transport protein (Tim44 family)